MGEGGKNLGCRMGRAPFPQELARAALPLKQNVAEIRLLLSAEEPAFIPTLMPKIRANSREGCYQVHDGSEWVDPNMRADPY